MNWVEYLLSGARSPLGFKKLRTRSALVAEFLRDHANLEIADHARRHGRPGFVVPNMADTGNKLSVYISFFFMEALLAHVENVQVGIIGSGQAFGSTLESRIATGLLRLIAGHHLPFDVFTRGMERQGGPASLTLTD